MPNILTVTFSELEKAMGLPEGSKILSTIPSHHATYGTTQFVVEGIGPKIPEGGFMHSLTMYEVKNRG